MTAAEFRRIALAFEGVVEGSHMGHPDFRVSGKKIFCTLNAEETRGMVSLTPDQQKTFIGEHPGMFVPASGAWGVQGSTMVELSRADPEVVGEAMTSAWQRVTAAMATSGTNRRAKSGAGRGTKAGTRRPAAARKRGAAAARSGAKKRRR